MFILLTGGHRRSIDTRGHTGAVYQSLPGCGSTLHIASKHREEKGWQGSVSVLVRESTSNPHIYGIMIDECGERDVS